MAVDFIQDVAALEMLLSEPSQGVLEMLERVEGDIVILGVGGKMGPTLARMVRRASQQLGDGRRIFGVARFSSLGLEQRLQHWGIHTIGCNLLDEQALGDLPEAPNVIYMAGMKFGATGNEPMTWAMNSYLPGMVCNRYRRSRIVAFSTGNVYGLTPAAGGGSKETDTPAPVGEYAMSCLGRERIIEHYSVRFRIPSVLIRLNYAVEMRYGVLLDIARKVWNGQAIDLGMGYVNVIWQGDANAMVIRALGHAAVPPLVLNVTGPEVLSVRRVAEELGELLGKRPIFAGTEGPSALLSDSSKAQALFGPPSVPAAQVMRWVAEWVKGGGETLDKPTHFESRDGKF